MLQQGNDRKKAGTITKQFQAKIRNQLKQIVTDALQAEAPPPPTKPKRGRKAKSKPIRLLEVFRDQLDEVLRFLYDPAVPFDNNQAERDLRMMKLKQKISGGFRSTHGIESYCNIRSYTSTLRKQHKNVWQAITQAIQGTPTSLLVSD